MMLQVTVPMFQPEGTFSDTVYVVNVRMLVKSFSWLSSGWPGSSTNEKFEGGEGDGVKLKTVGPFESASLMMSISAGKITAVAVNERSCAPAWQESGGRQSKESWLMW